MKYIAPTPFAKSFTCPQCGVYAQINWYAMYFNGVQLHKYDANGVYSGRCEHCNKHSIFIGTRLVHPATGTAPNPNVEMPEDVKAMYTEAAAIVAQSPRSAAALLRLGIQLLCKHLGEKGKNINDDIAALVKKGLPAIVQQSLDVVRVTGNEAVHPGTIATDDANVVHALFELVNIIVEYMIAMPKRVGGLYQALPAGALAGINKRDT